MCLLDQVLSWDGDSIVCDTETHRDVNNPLRCHGKLSAVHALEYGAQAAAIHGGLRARAAGTTAPAGYIAAVRDAHLHVGRLDDISGRLQVRARRLFGENANTIYQCEILSGEKSLASGRITIMVSP